MSCTFSGGFGNLKGIGGRKQCISLIVMYRKCTLGTIRILYGKRRLSDKNSEANRAWPPFESATRYIK